MLWSHFANFLLRYHWIKNVIFLLSYFSNKLSLLSAVCIFSLSPINDHSTCFRIIIYDIFNNFFNLPIGSFQWLLRNIFGGLGWTPSANQNVSVVITHLGIAVIGWVPERFPGQGMSEEQSNKGIGIDLRFGWIIYKQVVKIYMHWCQWHQFVIKCSDTQHTSIFPPTAA